MRAANGSDQLRRNVTAANSQRSSRRHRLAVVVALAVSLAACGDAPARRSGVATAGETSLDSLLSVEQQVQLGRSLVPVLVPTWLPEWAKGVRPEVAVFPVGGYAIEWKLSVFGPPHPLTSKLKSDVSIEISGELEPEPQPTPSKQAWPTRIGPQTGRTYRWNPENDICGIERGEDVGVDAHLQWEPSGSNVVHVPPAPPLPPSPDTDEPKPDDVGPDPPSGPRYIYYNVSLSLGPACSQGELTPDDMMNFVESVQPLIP